MSHGKETPRQKMIGMMYLVLMALLAMNVQKEVLDAFVNVNHGLTKTIATFDERNAAVYDDFLMKAEANPSKVTEWKDKAFEVKQRADELFNLIQHYKVEIVKVAEGEDSEAIQEDHINMDAIEAKDKMEPGSQVMIGDQNNKGGKELKEKFIEFREYCLSIIPENKPSIRESILKNLNTDDHIGKDKTKHPWERHNFENLPLAGVISIMSGLQVDVRNTESEVISYLQGQIEAGTFKFTGLESTVIPKSNYVLQGEDYEAEIFLAAFDTTQEPEILIGTVDSVETNGSWEYIIRGDSTVVPVKNGKGILRQAGKSLGNRSYEGIIRLKRLTGGNITRKFSQQYTVAQGSYGVNPTKMNVFYLGVDNPVEVYVSGYQSNQIQASITNGRIQRRGNNWVVLPARPGNALITVSVREDGQTKTMGYEEFRVKQVPDPIAKIGGSKGGAIGQQVLLAQYGIAAEMENFDFELEYKVTEYIATAVIRGFTREEPVKGNIFSPPVKELISSLSRGDRITFTDIKAVGPDGTVRRLNSVSFKLN